MSGIIWENSYIIENLLNRLKEENTYIIYIKGIDCPMIQDYFSVISRMCGFPILTRTWDGYCDWMCDFFDINEDRIALVIDGFRDFLKKDYGSKIKFIATLESAIIPWWNCTIVK